MRKIRKTISSRASIASSSATPVSNAHRMGSETLGKGLEGQATFGVPVDNAGGGGLSELDSFVKQTRLELLELNSQDGGIQIFHSEEANEAADSTKDNPKA